MFVTKKTPIRTLKPPELHGPIAFTEDARGTLKTVRLASVAVDAGQAVQVNSSQPVSMGPRKEE